MKTKVYELVVKVYTMKTMNVDDSHNRIAKLIDKTLCKEEDYEQLHLRTSFKSYNFSNLSLPEGCKFTVASHFKEGTIYDFKFRTVDEKLAKYIELNMLNEYTSYLKVLTIAKRVIPFRHIESVRSITPTVVKFSNRDIKSDKRYWRGNKSMSVIEDRVKTNLIKKYNSYFGVRLKEDASVFNTIVLKNKVPLVAKYKNKTILGDKFEIDAANDSLSQELLYFALGVGLGEMNARGFGFLGYTYL